jgi:hypothetical protein
VRWPARRAGRPPWAARQQVQVQGNCTSMPWRKLPTAGTNTGPACEAGVAQDLGQVLVLEAQGIGSNSGAWPCFIGFDHGAAAARIAADRRQRERKIACGTRPHPPAGAAARWRRWRSSRGWPRAASRTACAGPAASSGKPNTQPAPCGARCWRRSLDLAAGGLFDVVDHGHGLACRVVVQAQHHQVHARNQVALGGGSLRNSGAMLTSSIWGMACRRSRICRPVVPASPSDSHEYSCKGGQRAKGWCIAA